MDVHAQLTAVARGLETKEVDGVRSYVQTLAQTYPSPIDDVWDAYAVARVRHEDVGSVAVGSNR